MEVKISLSDIALMLNISKHTLRYYDKVGLIEPNYDTNGYRYYTFEHFYILSAIKLLREMDVPIKEIKDSIHDQELEDFTDLLVKSKIYVDGEIKRLTKMSRLLDEKLRAADHHRELSNRWFIHEIKETTYYYFGGIEFNEGEGIRLVKEMFYRQPNIIYGNNLMLSYRREDIEGVVAGVTDLYVQWDGEEDIEGIDILELPVGRYATFYYKGNEENLQSSLNQAMQELEDNGYKLGDRIYEHLRPSHLISGSMTSFFAEYMIQII